MAKVIRVVQYEGDEASIRHALSLSRPANSLLDCKGYTLTVVELSNDLPSLLPDIDAADALAKLETFELQQESGDVI